MRSFLKYLITLLVGFAGVAAWLFSRDFWVQTELVKIFHILTDAFFVVGVLMTGLGLLVFVSNEGAFDGLTFGLKSFFEIFKKNSLRSHETYFDYRTRKSEKKLPFAFILICGLFFLAVSVVMLMLYTKYS